MKFEIHEDRPCVLLGGAPLRLALLQRCQSPHCALVVHRESTLRDRHHALERLELVAHAVPRPRAPRSDRVFLRDGDRCWIVAVSDVVIFEADGNYTRGYFGSERPMARTPLQAVEARLDPAHLFRASRRHVINLRRVEGVEHSDDDSYIVRLRGGDRIAVSRPQSRKLRETLAL